MGVLIPRHHAEDAALLRTAPTVVPGNGTSFAFTFDGGYVTFEFEIMWPAHYPDGRALIMARSRPGKSRVTWAAGSSERSRHGPADLGSYTRGNRGVFALEETRCPDCRSGGSKSQRISWIVAPKVIARYAPGRMTSSPLPPT